MKYIFRSFLAILFICHTASAISVKVLLDEQKDPVWELSAPRGFQLQDARTAKKRSLGATYHKIVIKVIKDRLFLNGKRCTTDSIVLRPMTKGTLFQEGVYNGAFLITRSNGSYLLINIVDLEEYVFCVLKTESWPGWPLEINKALAVSVRSYVLYQLVEAVQRSAPYHIRNTNHHQTYAGIHECVIQQQAVEETRGLFLGHKGNPILAMFDTCCGGVIPSQIDIGIDFKKAPYLARKYPCTYCKKWKHYSWKVEYSLKDFRDRLQEGVETFMHDIRDVKSVRKGSNGQVKALVARTVRQEHSFSHRQIYKLLKEVKSFTFSAERKAKKIVITGKGYGHHMGLCQWGAREMVTLGWSFDAILRFFYPGTTFMRVEESD